MSNNKSQPLSPEKKRALGYPEIGAVNGVPVFLALRVVKDSKLIPAGSARDVFIAAQKELAMGRETRRQQGTADVNAPMVFQVSTSGSSLLIKETGTRRWAVLSKAKALELCDRVAELRAFVQKLPNSTSTVNGDE